MAPEEYRARTLEIITLVLELIEGDDTGRKRPDYTPRQGQ